MSMTNLKRANANGGRKNLVSLKNKLKKYTEQNCDQAKERSKTSFGTMQLIFKQFHKHTRELNFMRVEQTRYGEFLSSVKHFMENNQKCD